MKTKTGSNIQDVKTQNRLLVLKHIALHKGISRVDIARITGLSKMTIGNIVTELLEAHMVVESASSQPSNIHGRKPILLSLSDQSPCICGMLIKRRLCQVILSDLSGTILFQVSAPYETLTSPEQLLELLMELYKKAKASIPRRILAIGIASLGPLNSSEGMLLKPPFFYGIENLPIVSIVREQTGLPVFLVNDSNAGAFAEKLYGLGTSFSNFAYLHIMNGIGAGFVLNDTLYDGDSGQCGEIGHTSINFNGPPCVCGNRGCLELYASLEHMQKQIRDLAVFYPDSPLASTPTPKWNAILNAGSQNDALAIRVLEEFCSYIAHALTNTLNLLGISTVIVGYSSNHSEFLIEKILTYRLNAQVMAAKYQSISVVHSSFDGDAPLIGSIAFVVDKIFNGTLQLEEFDFV